MITVMVDTANGTLAFPTKKTLSSVSTIVNGKDVDQLMLMKESALSCFFAK